MKRSTTILNAKQILMATLMIMTVMVVYSCKKEVSENPTVFDPAVDGIAVLPVPDIDIRMAQRDASVPSYRNTAAFEGQIVRTPDLADLPVGLDDLSVGLDDLPVDLFAPSSTDPNFL